MDKNFEWRRTPLGVTSAWRNSLFRCTIPSATIVRRKASMFFPPPLLPPQVREPSTLRWLSLP